MQYLLTSNHHYLHRIVGNLLTSNHHHLQRIVVNLLTNNHHNLQRIMDNLLTSNHHHLQRIVGKQLIVVETRQHLCYQYNRLPSEVYHHGDYEDYDQNLAENKNKSSNVIKPTGYHQRCITMVITKIMIKTRLKKINISSNVIKPTGSDKRCMTYVTSSEVLVTCLLHVVMSAMISM